MAQTGKPASGKGRERDRADAADVARPADSESASRPASEIDKPIGARPRSEVTGRHDAGSGANETIDGLDATSEAIRRAAEDIPIGAPDDAEDLPVFDRGGALPKK